MKRVSEVGRVERILSLLRRQAGRLASDRRRPDRSPATYPFRVLVSCLLSLRTKDEVTDAASERLFKHARTPWQMVKLPARTIERLIFPVGFYRVKARTIRNLSGELIRRHGGRVPDDLDGLLRLKGVGRKTANLVLGVAYGKPAICVDTHVYRISNRLGLVSTTTPAETEKELEKKLPRHAWIEINHLMVTHGRNICKPISPLCSRCLLRLYCERVGVTRSR